MAEIITDPATLSVAPVPVEDPYDLGDTELHFETRSSSPVAESPAESTQPAPQAPPLNAAGRPYDPDTGRLLPVNPEPEPTPTPPASDHPKLLLEQAAEFGMDQEDLAQPTAALQRQVNRLLWQREQYRKQNDTQHSLEQAQVKPAAKPAEPTAEAVDEFKQYEEAIAPEILTLLRSQSAKIKDLESKIDSRIAPIEQTIERNRQESLTNWADRLFTQHGNKAVVGEGPITSLKEGSKEIRIRNSVLAHARNIAGPKASSADVVRKIPEALAELGMSAAPEPQPAPVVPAKANGKPKISKEQWNDGALSAPTARRNGAEPKGEAKAIATLDAKMRERGIHPEQHDDSEELDTLL